ncbi:ATP-dependent DNA helicase Pif1-like [Oratosquilla oratoria]|uniref:ATP-dependent DNA helicase Pif1-like n=1 Tax=Oratosquilla oratoria TaxID=337810 RepID=UPI003F75EF27
MANLLEMTSLIVWDEAVMANKNTITALDITLRDILGVNRFMGGVVFVCAGDFRQILPVVRGGDEIDCCIKSSYFGGHLSHLELTQNVRLKNDDVLNRQFARELLELGTTHKEEYVFPTNFGVIVNNREELVKRVYDKFEENFLNISYFEKRTIISPTNDDVDCINDMVFKRLNTEAKIYRSEDTSVDNEMDIQTSVYNSINSPSIPLHELKMKIGAVVMVMKNICPPKLCNGTRIIVTNLQKNIIVGNILTGAYRGEQVMLPRITLESTDTSVIFKRKQFPIRLCYAMTINKSQGQTFDRCGLLLDRAQCFAHGQLYVACSRVTSHDSLIVYTGYRKQGDEYVRKPARNCVYKELFTERDEKTPVIDKCSGKQSSKEDFMDLKVIRCNEEARIAEEEPDHSISVLPSITEEEAVSMIMPEEFYNNDYSDNENHKKELESVKELMYKIIGSSDEDVSPPIKKRKIVMVC